MSGQGGSSLLAPPKSLPGGGGDDALQPDVGDKPEKKAKGTVPEFGGFGENNAGFTGLFEVKKKARKERGNELDFPEPLEPINFDKPKYGLNGRDDDEEEENTKEAKGGCCTVM